MAARKHSKPIQQVKIAKERIAILFDEAARTVKADQKLANRYVELARKIGMRYNVRIPPELRKKVCRSCKSYLYPGITASQRTEKGWLVITCRACGKKNRFSLERARRKKSHSENPHPPAASRPFHHQKSRLPEGHAIY